MATPQPQPQAIQIEFDVPATMRDGTTLRANIYRPAGAGPWPVLLTRLPYGKDLPLGTALLDPVQAARRGYLIVVQDTRGRFSSEGEWYPLIDEGPDGYDSVEWAAGLPGSSGRVGMYGASYFGFTQWAAARERPPHLRALFPYVSWADVRDGTSMRGGALELGLQGNWLLQNTLSTVFRRNAGNPDPRVLGAELARLIGELDGLPHGGYRELPLRAFGPLKRVGSLRPFADVFTRHTDHDYIARASVAPAYERLNLPAYHAGGWYDIFLGGTLRNFSALTARGAAPQKLLIGPWTHGNSGEFVGDQDYGFTSAAALIDGQIDFMSLQLLWFDRWLKDVPNGIETSAPIKLFVMGENVWRDEREWPLKRAEPTPFYLRSGGHANSLDGDGTLSTQAPGAEPADRYAYDPRDPVPTLGGALLIHVSFRAGPCDQRPVERRPDVLVYSTPPLETDVEVTGPIGVTLWAASSAPDTDFVARLVDVFPDGRAINLTDGILRARFRAGIDAPEALIEPGRAYEYQIDLWATSNLFRAGHRIRVDITSSSFPRWDRNPNTGAPLGEGTELVTATQTILHDSDHPSRILLPLVARA
ncbi:MAG TPA: CocE/NonD family hydrolase [Ktedonobacterales bacterium]|nr:CocE/NonD family hydrolase [Ktedonobacterales bacterium]